jgi:hypothetical protein
MVTVKEPEKPVAPKAEGPKRGPKLNKEKAAETAETANLQGAVAEVETGPVVDPEVLKAEAASLKETINTYADQIDSGWFELANALLEAKTKKYFKEWGYDTIEKFVEAELERIGVRQARYLIVGAEAAKLTGLSKAQVVEMGWYKLGMIAAAIVKDVSQAPKLLDMAREQNQRQLAESMKVEHGRGPTADVTKLSFKLIAEAGKIVADALTLANSELQKEDNNAAIVHICTEWAMAKGATGGRLTAEDLGAFIENNFPFTVTLEPREEEAPATAATEGGEEVEGELDDLLALAEEE